VETSVDTRQRSTPWSDTNASTRVRTTHRLRQRLGRRTATLVSLWTVESTTGPLCYGCRQVVVGQSAESDVGLVGVRFDGSDEK